MQGTPTTLSFEQSFSNADLPEVEVEEVAPALETAPTKTDEVSTATATQSVRRFFKTMLEGRDVGQRARTVRSAGEWPKLTVDDFFDRVLTPQNYSYATSGANESPVQRSAESSGTGRVTMRDAFSGFIWSS